jgi:hypothetical protein
VKAILVLLAILAVFVPTGGALQPGPATIKATTEIVAVGKAGAVTTRTYRIYNRPSFHDAIGTAVLTCVKLAAGAIACHEYFRFRQGQIVTEGLVAGTVFYRLAVVGGTGVYDNAGGTLTVQQLTGRTQQVVFDLNAF